MLFYNKKQKEAINTFLLCCAIYHKPDPIGMVVQQKSKNCTVPS